MKQSLNQIQTLQILYELAMSIGTSLDLRAMLKVSLLAFLKKLDCVAGGVYQYKAEGDAFRLEEVYTIPRHTSRNITYQAALTQLPTAPNTTQMSQLLDTLPLVGQSGDDNFYHLLDVPGFGVMVLIKNKQALDPVLIKSLRPLQEKLAAAANACLSEENLRKTQRQSQTILESITTPLLISRISDGLILYANDLLADMIGTTTELLIGNITPDFYANADDRTTLLTKLRAQGVRTNYELQIKKSDGELIWVLLSIKPFNYQGEPALISTFLEITERKQTLQQLEDSQKRTRAVLESVTLPLIISRLDDGTVLYANDRVMEMMDLQADEIVGSQTPNFYQNPEDRAKVVRGTLTHGGVDNMELPILRKGEPRWALISNRLTEYDNQRAIITTLVDITDRKLAEEALAKRAAEMETVARVSASTASILETDKLLQEVVDLTKERFGLYHAHVYLLNKAGDTLILTAGAGEIGQKMVAEKRSIPLNQEQSLVAQAARTRQGIIENDVLNNPAFLPHPLLPDTRAEMAVPMLIGNKLIGVMDVQAGQISQFTQQDIIIQTTLAAQIAVALENARSFENARTSLAETEALLDITKESSRTLELQTILESVLDRVLAATKFEAGLISLENPDTQALELFSHRLPDPFLHTLQKQGLDNTLCDLVYRRRETVVVVDLTDDAPVDVSGLISMGYESYQGVPIEAKGNTFGTICLFSTRPLASDEANTVFLQAVGQQVGIAIQNANLLKQTQVALAEVEQSQEVVQEYLDMQRVLHEINTELLQVNDLDELYRRAIELAYNRLGFERIGMFLLNEAKDTLLGTYGVDTAGNIRSEQSPEHIITDPETIKTFILSRTRLRVSEDADLLQEGEVVGHGWHIGAAMWAEESPIGVIFADNLVTGQPLKPYQSELLFAYAGTVANLIVRRRVEETIRERETLLRTIIDSTPDWIFVKDREHRYRLVNQGYADSMHIAPEAFIGKNDLDIGFPEDIVKGNSEKGIRGFWADDNEIMARGERKIIDEEPAVVDGETRTLHTVKAPLHSADGEVTGLVGFVHDITSRKQVEITLHQSEEKFRSLFEQSSDAYLILEDNLFVDCNQATVDMLRASSKEEVLSLHPSQISPEMQPDGRPSGAKADEMIQIALGKGNHRFEWIHRRVNDEDFAAEVVLTPIQMGGKGAVFAVVRDVTDRKQVQEALRESEERSRTILDNANEIIFTLNPDGSPNYLSPAWTNLLGYSIEEALGRPFTSYVHPDDTAKIFAFMERIFATGESQRGIQYRIQHENGSWRWFSANGSMATDEDGNFLYFVGLAQDITEQKTAAEALQAAKEHTETILRSITVPIVISRIKSGEIGYANEHLAQMVRMPLDELVGNATPNFYVDNEDRTAVVGKIQTEGSINNYQLQLRRTDGEVFWALLSARLIEFEGEPAIITSLIDITDRKAAEEKVRANETLMRTIIDSTPDWIFVKDQDHRYQMVNKGYADTFQIHPEDFIGKNDLDIGFPEDIVKGNPEKGIVGFWPDDKEVMACGEMKVIDIEPAVVGGKDVFLSTIKTPLRDAEGNVTGVVGFVHDITTRIKVEETLRQSEAELSQALEVAKLAYWEYDAEKDMFTFNDQFYALFRTTAEQHGGYQLPSAYYALHFVYPDDIPMVGAEIERTLTSSGRHYDNLLEHRILYADGGIGYVSVNINLERDEYGNILRIYGANQDITERKRNEEAIAKQAQDLQIVAELSKTVATTLEQEKLLQEVVDLTKEQFNLYHTHIYLLDPQGETLVLSAGAGEVGRKMTAEDRRIPLTQEQSLVARAARTRQGVIINDVQTDPGFLSHPLLPETRSEMAVPMISGDKLVGVLDVQANQTNAFDIDSVNIQTTLAAQIAIALENVRLLNEVQENEEQYRTILDNASEIVFTLTPDGNFTYLSPAWTDLLGYSVEEGEGHSFTEFLHPDDIANAFTFMEEIAVTGKSEHGIVYRQRHKNGEWRWYTTNGSAVKDENGNILYFIGLAQDITEQKMAEGRVRANETLLRTIIDSTPDWIFVKDRDHRYQMVNKGYADAFQISPKEFIGKNDLDIGFPEDIVKGNPEEGIRGFWADDLEIMESGQLKVIDSEPAVVDGEQRYLHTIKAPLKDVDGKVTAVIGFVHDITDRIQVEEKLAKQANELADLTRRLTREGWQDFLNYVTPEEMGYVYNRGQVGSLKPSISEEADLWLETGSGGQSAKPLIQPISIHGETIGRLAVLPDEDEDEVDAEIAEIIRSVTEQLQARIENLRLTDQTQIALAQTEEQAQRLGLLNEMSAALNHASSLNDIYQVSVDETTKIMGVQQTSISLLTDSKEYFEVIATSNDDLGLSLGVQIPVTETPMQEILQENRVVQGALDGVFALSLHIPLVVGNDVVGVMNVGYKEDQTFKASDESLLRQIAALVSSNIENMRFLVNERSRAQREQMLRQITQRIRSSADVETIMRTAVQEIGRTLGRKTYIYLGEDHEA
ncbi:MAG: PAS domain S-box protein [Ardenticatenaceae bacterium]|nr:PAS domain S-box protein [Ardenticatenaceae bacterium]MCB9445247.1 PAS domain S-box protein [Ardenticatenaceae bacterium]